MILLIHMVFGAAIGYQAYFLTNNIWLALLFALLSHYFLDIFPHIEYLIDNIRNRNWGKSMPDILKVILDFLLGWLIILIFSTSQPLIYICAIVAILPDGATVISSIFKNRILALHDTIHIKKIHFLKYKKFSNFWRILTQAAAVVISIILLKLPFIIQSY